MTHLTRAGFATMALLTASTLTACGTDQDTVDVSSPTDSTTTEPSITPTPTATDTPSPSATPSVTQPPSQTLMPSGVATWPGMLSAADLPAGPWQVLRTSDGVSPTVSTCHLADPISIGGKAAQHRVFESAEGSAEQTIVRLADPKTAKRTYAVLRSWQQDCAENAPGSTATAVAVPAPPAGSSYAAYVVTTQSQTFLQVEIRELDQLSLLTVEVADAAVGQSAARGLVRRLSQRLTR